MATMTTQAVWVEKLNWEELEFAPPSLVEGSGSGSGLVSSISISMTRSLVFVVVVVVVVVVVAVAVVVGVSDAVVLGSVAVVVGVVLGVVLASLISGGGVDVKGWRSLEAKVAVAVVVVVVGSIDDQQCSQSKLGKSNSTVALRICFCFSTVSSTWESGKQKVNILVHSEISMSKARQVALPLTGL